MLPIDALGFRRGAGALATLLEDTGLADHPLFAQAETARHPRAFRPCGSHRPHQRRQRRAFGHRHRHGRREGGVLGLCRRPSLNSPKIFALEGEFALTEGHAQEFKTQALALQVGKRLRVLLSDNNAGIDDSLLGGVIASRYEAYRLVDQWTSYGWNVLPDGARQRLRADPGGAQNHGRLGPRGPPSHGGDRQDHQGLLAGRGGRQNSRLRRPVGGLQEPSLRDEDELRLFRRAGADLREALRRGVRRHPAGRR